MVLDTRYDNVAVSDFLKFFDISGRRLRLYRISQRAQQRLWFTPTVFGTFPDHVHKNDLSEEYSIKIETVWSQKKNNTQI